MYFRFSARFTTSARPFFRVIAVFYGFLCACTLHLADCSCCFVENINLEDYIYPVIVNNNPLDITIYEVSALCYVMRSDELSRLTDYFFDLFLRYAVSSVFGFKLSDVAFEMLFVSEATFLL